MEPKRRVPETGGLPAGWKREEVVRKSGLSAGKTDVYYYSPDGKKIRSKPQLARIIGDALDLSAFDFRTGRIIYSAVRKRLRHDASLVLPIRQTASIFKQPVTVIRNRPESQTKTELKHGPQDPPKQLFWEKRLQSQSARDLVEEVENLSMDLPKNMQGCGPEMTTENVFQSISAALHLSSVPITGQNASKSAMQKNPGVNIDTSQPHIQQMVIHEEDIRRQEARVNDARRKLQDVMMLDR
ncbi:methyl-CpG-binding domain protein 2-like isoform X2 [Haliotis cracherodii]|uniref:methyl-CpG-binding domain protein 2-like isoform X2 n=1 Tax=Haliotis rufescens TaxID=6454 RepID=UPI001EB05D66|nr:methyl-CpG-binding domain protein 2-like isoform X2 [Haliotis rufescens]